ncbi:class III signal peptide-containing protein [Candidatus Pacearchaeota archaeon]|nr:class III signal peptide-containing protein [Candidatus Pacearchaeota archaeon]
MKKGSQAHPCLSMRGQNKGQGAIEFMIIFGAVLFFFVLFFSVIQFNTSQKDKEKESLVAQSVVLDVQDEINLASEASDGYSRSFTIPDNILGKDYNINITGDRVYLEMEGFATSYKITNATGNLIKGTNLIRKESGVVYVN